MRALAALLLVATLGACSQGPTTLEERGEGLARRSGCLGCHTTDASDGTAPTWKGLFGSERKLDDGSTVTADDAYLRESILQPRAKTVEGYPEDLMETVIKPNSFTDEDLDALIAYIKTLS
jgi:cytochrome c oxidase subunit 2